MEQREKENENEKETFTHISNYLFKLLSRHIHLHHNSNMNLDGNTMFIGEIKMFKYCSNGLNPYLVGTIFTVYFIIITNLYSLQPILTLYVCFSHITKI